MMQRYMLDTNAVSALLKPGSFISKNIRPKPLASICISAITEAEILFGLAQRPDMLALHTAVDELLVRIEVLDWGRKQAEVYGLMRANLKKQNITVAPMDLLIAAHAKSMDAVLVTGDKAFSRIEGLTVEDWNSSL